MRDIDTDVVTELLSPVCAPAYLADLEFDSGTLYMWTGIGTITWNGNDYIGGGALIGLSGNEETQELQAKGITCSLSGIPTDLIALALTEKSRGRAFRLYLAMIDPETASVIGTPYRQFTGLMDVIECKDNGREATLTLSVENRMLVGQKAKERRYTSEDQKKYYPSDAGFDLIPQLQDKEVTW